MGGQSILRNDARRISSQQKSNESNGFNINMFLVDFRWRTRIKYRYAMHTKTISYVCYAFAYRILDWISRNTIGRNSFHCDFPVSSFSEEGQPKAVVSNHSCIVFVVVESSGKSLRSLPSIVCAFVEIKYTKTSSRNWKEQLDKLKRQISRRVNILTWCGTQVVKFLSVVVVVVVLPLACAFFRF